MQDFICIALKEAKHSPLYNQHGAVLVDRRGKIVSKAHNRYSYLKPFGRNRVCSLHAEVALFAGLSKQCKRPMKLLVVRIIKDGQLGMSHPCASCQIYLRKRKHVTVYFTNNEGQICKWNK